MVGQVQRGGDAEVGARDVAADPVDLDVGQVVDAVGDTEVGGLVEDPLQVGGLASHKAEVDAVELRQRLDEGVHAAGRGHHADVQHQRHVRAEPGDLADAGAGVVRVGSARGRVAHDGRLGLQPVVGDEQLDHHLRDGGDGVGVRGVLRLVGDHRLVPARVAAPRVDPGEVLVGVPDELHVPALGAGAELRPGADAEHPEVVGVDQVGRQLVDHRSHRELPVPQAGVELAPGALAHRLLPERGGHPVQRRVQALPAPLERLGPGEAYVDELAVGLGVGPAGQDPGTLRQRRHGGLLAVGQLRGQGDASGAGLLAAREGHPLGVLRHPARRVGERRAQRSAAELVAPLRQRQRHRHQAHPGVAELPAVLLVVRGLAEQYDVPAALGHRPGLLLHPGVALDAVVDEHHDTASAPASLLRGRGGCGAHLGPPVPRTWSGGHDTACRSVGWASTGAADGERSGTGACEIAEPLSQWSLW